jgi:hypothetical protein
MKESKEHGSKLIEAIKNSISQFHEKHAAKSSDAYNTRETAKILSINEDNFRKYIKGNIKIPFKFVLNFISMPWVSEKEAQRFIFLWVVEQIDSYKIKKGRILDKKNTSYIDDGIPFLDENRIPWTPDKQREQLDKWAASLDKLANYTETLGIIDQIDYARERQRKVIKNNGYVEDEYVVPVQGPKISLIDFENFNDSNTKTLIQKRQADVRKEIHQRPMTDIILKFAKDLAELEAKERIDMVLGYLKDDIIEKMKDEIDSKNEEDIEDIEDNQGFELKDLDIEVADHLKANKSANSIMILLKANSKNIE